jgi:hypothetical protein
MLVGKSVFTNAAEEQQQGVGLSVTGTHFLTSSTRDSTTGVGKHRLSLGVAVIAHAGSR